MCLKNKILCKAILPLIGCTIMKDHYYLVLYQVLQLAQMFSQELKINLK